MPVSDSSDIYPFDDINLVPHDRVELYGCQEEDRGNSFHGRPRRRQGLLNNISYTAPKVPTLYAVVSSGDQAGDAEIYGDYTYMCILLSSRRMKSSRWFQGSQQPGHQLSPISFTQPYLPNFAHVDRFPGSGENFFDYDAGNTFATFDESNHAAFPTYPALNVYKVKCPMAPLACVCPDIYLRIHTPICGGGW